MKFSYFDTNQTETKYTDFFQEYIFLEVQDFTFKTSYWAELFFIISNESVRFSAHFNIWVIFILIIVSTVTIIQISITHDT